MFQIMDDSIAIKRNIFKDNKYLFSNPGIPKCHFYVNNSDCVEKGAAADRRVKEGDESQKSVAIDAYRQALARIEELDPGHQKSILLITGSTAVYERISQINRHAGRVPVVSMLPDIVRAGEESALLSIGVNMTSALTLATR